jgi:hypothetical protein
VHTTSTVTRRSDLFQERYSKRMRVFVKVCRRTEQSPTEACMSDRYRSCRFVACRDVCAYVRLIFLRRLLKRISSDSALCRRTDSDMFLSAFYDDARHSLW